MKSFFKKSLAVIMVITMMFSCVPLLSGSFSFTASAAETEGYYTYVISENQAIIADCDSSVSGDIIIPSTLGGYPVTGIASSAFKKCVGITGVVIPDSVIYIDKYAFSTCESLEEVSIPGSVESIGKDAFYRCYNLKEIVVDEENEYYSSDEYGVLFNKEKTELIAYPASNEAEHYVIPDSVAVIAEGAFRYAKNLAGVTIPDGIVTLETYVFRECTSLKSVTIPDSVTEIKKYAFYKCTTLSEVEIGNNVVTIGEAAFTFCPIDILVIPDSVKTIGDSAFNDVNEFYIGKNVEKYGGMPKKAKAIVDSENQYYYSDEYGALYNNEKTLLLHFPSSCELDEYDIPYGVETIGKGAFRNSQLKTINIPSSVKFIGDSAFWDCDNLTHIIFPEGVTELGNTVLFGCYAIEYIHLPKSLTKIGHNFETGCGVFKFCTVSDDCYAKTYVEENFGANLGFWYTKCDGHGLPEDDHIHDDNTGDDNTGDDNINDDNTNGDNTGDDNTNDDIGNGNTNDDDINDDINNGNTDDNVNDNTGNNDNDNDNVVDDMPPINVLITPANITSVNYGDTLVLSAEAIGVTDDIKINWIVEGTGFTTRVSDNGKECYITSTADGSVTITVQLVDSDGEVITDAEGNSISDKVTVSSNAGFFQKLISFFKSIFGIFFVVDRIIR